MEKGKLSDNLNYLLELLRKEGIDNEKILTAISKVPRENFVSETQQEYAYENRPLPIPCGQTISQPYTVAFMLLLLEVKPAEKILEVGTGSGYEAALLAELGANVYTIERIPELANYAQRNIKKLGYKVDISVGDGTLGLEDKAPFDGIIVSAAAPSVPESLTVQLKPEGKIVIPVGDRFSQKILCGKKISVGRKFLMEYSSYENFVFVPLIGKDGF